MLDYGQETWPGSTAVMILIIPLNSSVMLYIPISYSHLSGKCRRKVLVSMCGETEDISCPANCCDVCQMEVATLHERREELLILIQASDVTYNGRGQSHRMGSGWSDSMDGEYPKRK